ncbi:unnamed protein product [Effrenium voratum]|nr:unnamed protein product [Effrenium voratum]
MATGCMATATAWGSRSGRTARSTSGSGSAARPTAWATSSTATGTPTTGSGSTAGPTAWGSTASRMGRPDTRASSGVTIGTAWGWRRGWTMAPATPVASVKGRRAATAPILGPTAPCTTAAGGRTAPPGTGSTR